MGRGVAVLFAAYHRRALALVSRDFAFCFVVCLVLALATLVTALDARLLVDLSKDVLRGGTAEDLPA